MLLTNRQPKTLGRKECASLHLRPMHFAGIEPVRFNHKISGRVVLKKRGGKQCQFLTT